MSQAVILLISVLLLVIGAFLIKRGWWPRRVGDTPHCSKCDYILSGDQRRCPECGTVAESRNVVRGERHRRIVMAGAGGVMLLFGGWLLMAIVTGALLNNVNWRHHEPLSWLLKGVENINTTEWVEIKRRLDNNLLSESDQNAIVERGLQVQNMQSPNLLAANVLDYIGSRYVNAKLTPTQADRFFANMLKVNLTVRPVIGTQSPVPYSVVNIGRGPGPTMNWWYRLRTLESQVDEGPAMTNVVRTTSGGNGFGLSVESSPAANSTLAPVATPGRHRLRVKVQISIGTSGGIAGANWDEKAVATRRVTQDLFANFTAIEGQTPIATVTTPDAATMRAMLTPRLILNPSRDQRLYFTVFASGALPVDAGFDVFLRFDGKEYPMGSVSMRTTVGGGNYIATNSFPGNAPANVDVILRSSEAVARQTVDITRIWKGEIVLKDLPMDRQPGSKP